MMPLPGMERHIYNVPVAPAAAAFVGGFVVGSLLYLVMAGKLDRHAYGTWAVGGVGLGAIVAGIAASLGVGS